MVESGWFLRALLSSLGFQQKNRSIRVAEILFFNGCGGLRSRDQLFFLDFFSGSAEAFQAFLIRPLRTIASSQLLGRLWRL